jgi:hypothetical protein
MHPLMGMDMGTPPAGNLINMDLTNMIKIGL